MAATTTAVLRSGEETMRQVAKDELKALEGLTLDHRVRTSEKGAVITMQEFGDRPIFDFGKNSYLGLGVSVKGFTTFLELIDHIISRYQQQV